MCQSKLEERDGGKYLSIINHNPSRMQTSLIVAPGGKLESHFINLFQLCGSNKHKPDMSWLPLKYIPFPKLKFSIYLSYTNYSVFIM